VVVWRVLWDRFRDTAQASSPPWSRSPTDSSCPWALGLVKRRPRPLEHERRAGRTLWAVARHTYVVPVLWTTTPSPTCRWMVQPLPRPTVGAHALGLGLLLPQLCRPWRALCPAPHPPRPPPVYGGRFPVRVTRTAPSVRALGGRAGRFVGGLTASPRPLLAVAPATTRRRRRMSLGFPAGRRARG